MIRAFFLPVLETNAQYLAAKLVLRLLDAAYAASHNAVLICGLSLRVLVLFRFPALSWLPATTTAQDAKCFKVGNCDISTPSQQLVQLQCLYLHLGSYLTVPILPCNFFKFDRCGLQPLKLTFQGK